MKVGQWMKIKARMNAEEWRKVEYGIKVEQGIKLNSDG